MPCSAPRSTATSWSEPVRRHASAVSTPWSRVRLIGSLPSSSTSDRPGWAPGGSGAQLQPQPALRRPGMTFPPPGTGQRPENPVGPDRGQEVLSGPDTTISLRAINVDAVEGDTRLSSADQAAVDALPAG